jgi:hypothetical protein
LHRCDDKRNYRGYAYTEQGHGDGRCHAPNLSHASSPEKRALSDRAEHKQIGFRRKNTVPILQPVISPSANVSQFSPSQFAIK